MNLAIIRWRIASSGGAERFIFDIASALAQRGVEVTLIAEECAQAADFAGRLVELPKSTGSRSRRYRRFQAAVSDVLARDGFTLIQSHERLLTADIYRAGDGVHAAWFERLRKVRPWWRGIGMEFDPMHRLYRETEMRMARESDMIFVANSALVAGELRDWLDLPASRIRLIENGVDLEKFAPPSPQQRRAARAALGIDGAGPVACYVGSGFERKGAFQLVHALMDPNLGELTAVVAGRDKAAGRLIQLADSLGLADRVVVTGPVGDVRSVLHAADLFVLPTLYDPMPNAALEALATGLPVVTTPDAGIADAIKDSGAGRVSVRDPEAVAEAMAAVLGELESAGRAARALRERFALRDTVAKWLDLYGELS